MEFILLPAQGKQNMLMKKSKQQYFRKYTHMEHIKKKLDNLAKTEIKGENGCILMSF